MQKHLHLISSVSCFWQVFVPVLFLICFSNPIIIPVVVAVFTIKSFCYGTSKQVKAKEPVRLRMKPLSNGNKSLYLDIYHNGKRTYEYLKLYLIPDAGDAIRSIRTR